MQRVTAASIVALVASVAAFGCSSGKSSDAPDGGAAASADAAVADGSVSSEADSAMWSISAGTRFSAEAIVLGLCRLKNVNPGGTVCTGLPDLIGCAREHCQLEECTGTCDEFLQCVLPANDQCYATDTCRTPQPCFDCIASLLVCASEQCTGLFSCGAETSGGACDQLEACCNAQPDPTACSGFAGAARMLGGDGACQMLIDDQGFINAYASKAACTF